MIAPDLFPFIHALDDESRAEVDRTARRVYLEPGALVCLEGDRCQAIPFVVSGEARVYRASPEGRVITLYRIAPGESCILTAS